MIALPASSTHTQDMFDQLRTAAELELIEITTIITDTSLERPEYSWIRVFENQEKGRRSQQSMHRECCDGKESSTKKKDSKKNKNTKSSLRKSSFDILKEALYEPYNMAHIIYDIWWTGSYMMNWAHLYYRL